MSCETIIEQLSAIISGEIELFDGIVELYEAFLKTRINDVEKFLNSVTGEERNK